jgi:hypothetical protein
MQRRFGLKTTLGGCQSVVQRSRIEDLVGGLETGVGPGVVGAVVDTSRPDIVVDHDRICLIALVSTAALAAPARDEASVA